MKSGYEVFWTDEALLNLKLIIDYFEYRWTERELRKFFQKLEKRIKLISQKPRLFPTSGHKPNIHRSVLSKQTTIYYKLFEQEKKVEITTLFDTRQNPKKLRT